MTEVMAGRWFESNTMFPFIRRVAGVVTDQIANLRSAFGSGGSIPSLSAKATYRQVVANILGVWSERSECDAIAQDHRV